MTRVKKQFQASRHRGNISQRFGRYVCFIDSGCWHWVGAKNEKGYGIIGKGGRALGNVKAHRISYELFYFEEPPLGKFVCHSCDNPPCVNPYHLFIGSAHDNFTDMLTKGRHGPPPHFTGEDAGNSKLKKEQVEIIRYLSQSGISSRKIAKRFNVSHSTILGIIHKKTWRDL